MDILINILVPIGCLLVGYILGSIPTAVWVGKIFYHQDPRDYGSHNAGGTNAGRLWGKKVGFVIILIDMFKTVLPMWLCWALLTFIPYKGQHGLCPAANEFNNLGFNFDYVISYPVYWISTIGCMIGHCWPIFAKFKGGKGASVFMGLTVCSNWLSGFIPGLMYFGILKWKKYVSLTAILTCVNCTILSWTWAILVMCKVIPADLQWISAYGPTLAPTWFYASVITISSIFVIARHHENIQRLIAGNERKITWMK